MTHTRNSPNASLSRNNYSFVKNGDQIKKHSIYKQSEFTYLITVHLFWKYVNFLIKNDLSMPGAQMYKKHLCFDIGPI